MSTTVFIHLVVSLFSFCYTYLCCRTSSAWQAAPLLSSFFDLQEHHPGGTRAAILIERSHKQKRHCRRRYIVLYCTESSSIVFGHTQLMFCSPKELYYTAVKTPRLFSSLLIRRQPTAVREYGAVRALFSLFFACARVSHTTTGRKRPHVGR